MSITNGIETDDTSVVRLVAPGTVRVNGPAAFRGGIVGGSVAVTGTVGLSRPVG